MAHLEEFPPETVEILDALSNETRFEIVQLLHREGLRFSEVLEATGTTPGALSPHLKKLQNVGIVQKVAHVRDEEEVIERYTLSRLGVRLLGHIYQGLVPYVRIHDDAWNTSQFGRSVPKTESVVTFEDPSTSDSVVTV